MLTLPEFAEAVPCSIETAQKYHAEILLAMDRWEINSLFRVAGFIATCAHESTNFSAMAENMNYSPQGLANTWPSRFAVDPKARPRTPNAMAMRLGRTPLKPCDQVALANLVYGTRMGNRPETNDGWNYRARGPLQLTGRDSYVNCGVALGIDLLGQPDLLLFPQWGCQAAGWFWATHGCNQKMDDGDFLAATKVVNGGTIGYEDGNDIGVDDRVEHFELVKRVLGIV